VLAKCLVPGAFQFQEHDLMVSPILFLGSLVSIAMEITETFSTNTDKYIMAAAAAMRP
jgi:hypothetical protein